MNTITTLTAANQKPSIRYDSHSLFELLRVIVDTGDEQALAEFHNRRTVFKDENERAVLFTHFLHILRERALSQNWNYLVVEKAVDLTQDKFTNLPEQGSKGPDCRKYFRAVLEYASSKVTEQAIEAELQLAYLLQRFVQRHFQFSLKEVKRCHNWSRFTWMINGNSLQLRMPRFISGRERRVWLEKHVTSVNHSNCNERDRVQEIIDEYFGSAEPVALDDAIIRDTRLSDTDLPWKLMERLKINGLAQIVAAEKADRLNEQRPAIRSLGKERLHEMVLAIFDRLCDDTLSDREIADTYELTRPTYSRWAGSSWQPGGSRNIPTLWANTAHILAQDPVFIQAAIDAGIWQTVQTITSNSL
ncbi:MAG: hypothetical protein CML13_06920 [Puniceicoccaceae bacterium]|nr:hypothetical protein [Puniceicoccaceae bacterium]|tara:strand:+ start:12615 stop:13694 length:1080 start_codon:yes stop_codon:yes gene_type:complete